MRFEASKTKKRSKIIVGVYLTSKTFCNDQNCHLRPDLLRKSYRRDDSMSLWIDKSINNVISITNHFKFYDVQQDLVNKNTAVTVSLQTFYGSERFYFTFHACLHPWSPVTNRQLHTPGEKQLVRLPEDPPTSAWRRKMSTCMSRGKPRDTGVHFQLSLSLSVC